MDHDTLMIVPGTYGDVLRVRAFGTPIPDKSHQGYATSSRTDPAVANWKRVVATYALQAKNGPLLTCPLRVLMVFWMPRGPKTPDDAVLYDLTPDGDNCFKSTADALQGVLYENDKQIVDGTHLQFFEERAVHQLAGVTIRIWPIVKHAFTYPDAMTLIRQRLVGPD